MATGKTMRINIAKIKADWKTEDEGCDATEAKSGNKCSDNKKKKIKISYTQDIR